VEKTDDQKFCQECGAAISKRAEICPHCGVRQAGTPQPRTTTSKVLIGCLLLVAVGVVGIPIIGIIAAIAIPKFANTKEKAYTAAMKSDLRNLVTAEETFWADSGKYTAIASRLSFNPSVGVSPPTISASKDHWSARVTHAQLPGKVCEISVNIRNALVPTAGDGEPACK
jgi:type IV pilus assembly protein PilA